MKKLRIKSQITVWQFILIVTIILGVIFGLLYLMDFNLIQNLKNTSRLFEIIVCIYTIILILYNSLTVKESYISEICVTDDSIILIYKIQNKVSHKRVINKNNIQAFVFNIDVKITKMKKQIIRETNYKFFVDLIEGKDFSVKNNNDILDITKSDLNNKLIYQIIDFAKYIPNSKINITSNDETVKAEIDYYKNFGRRLPFHYYVKRFYKQSIFRSVIITVYITLFISFFIYMLYQTTPAYLNPQEKEYIELIKNTKYYNKNYDRMIENLNEAEKIFSTDAYLYYKYAEIYKRKKDYIKAIDYAKIGISNLKNKSIYAKAVKYNMHIDIYLYRILADSYRKLDDWENAANAYTYVINNSNNKYSKVYFRRGEMYYKLYKYDEALQDFIKHKEIIENYMNWYAQSPKEIKPTYTYKDLININKRIEYSQMYINKKY